MVCRDAVGVGSGSCVLGESDRGISSPYGVHHGPGGDGAKRIVCVCVCAHNDAFHTGCDRVVDVVI